MNNKSQETYLSYKKALEFVGDSSTYQKQIFTLFCLWELFASFYIMGLPILTQPNTFICSLGETSFECSQFYAKHNAYVSRVSNFSMFDYLGFYNIQAAAALAVAMFLGMTIGGQEKLIMKHGIKRVLIISLNWQILSLTFLLFPNVYTQILASFSFGVGFGSFQYLSKKAIKGVSSYRF